MKLRGTFAALVFAAVTVALGGCGFQPVYGSAANGGAVPAAELAFVDVGLIPNREGQVLRQEIQRRLERGGRSDAKKYVLSVGYSVALEGLGVLQDTSVTRYRVHGRANWTLRGAEPGTPAITGGLVRSMDAVNAINQQFFAVDQSADAARVRVASDIAEQIVSQVASYFAAKDASRQSP